MVETIIAAFFTAAAAVPAFLALIFSLEALAGVARASSSKSELPENGARGSIAVLIPAHDEQAGLSSTIDSVRTQLRPGDRIVVVADNCTDDTARVAAAAGAEVFERHDPERRGKGYALDFGRRHLGASPADVVIVIDADCKVGPGAMDQLARRCLSSGRPIQGLDLMVAPTDSAIDYNIACFAWRVNNHVRPLGMSALGLPSRLMGTGMAFPWSVFEKAPLATGNVVEDLELGLALARAGSAPEFCPNAIVTSEFPSSEEGARSQRKRWEGGHLRMIKTATRQIGIALVERNWALLVLALDVATPPLTLLVLANVIAFGAAGLAFFMGAGLAPIVISAFGLGILCLSIGLCWRTFGSELRPSQGARAVAGFMKQKIAVYGDFLRQGFMSKWVRAERQDHIS